MSTPPPMPTISVQITVDSLGIATAEPSRVTVTGANTYLQFRLLVPHVQFFTEEPITVDGAPPGLFVGPWVVAPNKASLLDTKTANGVFDYGVKVVQAGSTVPITLTFSQQPQIENTDVL